MSGRVRNKKGAAEPGFEILPMEPDDEFHQRT